jgi:hypothetical protein
MNRGNQTRFVPAYVENGQSTHLIRARKRSAQRGEGGLIIGFHQAMPMNQT